MLVELELKRKEEGGERIGKGGLGTMAVVLFWERGQLCYKLGSDKG